MSEMNDDEDLELPMTPCANYFTSKSLDVFKQGAEAKLYKAVYFGRPAIVKERFSKKYRNEALDFHLTRERLKSEVKAIARCKLVGIDVPCLYHVDISHNIIVTELIVNSTTIRDYILNVQMKNEVNFFSTLQPLMHKIGINIAQLHQNNIIHGDLTTSNMLLREPFYEFKIVLIDFGLSFITNMVEDKAVDLYVLERAFNSTHVNAENLFDALLHSYEKANADKGADVIKRLEDVRLRGRKRLMIG